LLRFNNNAVAGDTAATAMTLRILDQRARLLGLYPEYGKTAAVLVSALPIGEPIQVEFVVPSAAREPADKPSAPGQPPFPWQKQLAPPDPEMFKDHVTGVWRSGRTE
jgi:hypothetical protein